MSEKSKGLTSKELEQKVDALIVEIEGIPNDPETLKAAEKLHRELSFLSPEDLLKPFKYSQMELEVSLDRDRTVLYRKVHSTWKVLT